MGENAAVMSIPPLATTGAKTVSEPRDHSPMKHIFFMGGGYKATWGLISRDFTDYILNI